MRKICVVIGSRANYSSIKSVMTAIKLHPKLQLQVVCTASSVLGRYGDVSKLIESDGFNIDERCFSLVEGETPLTMAMSTGIGLVELPSIFTRINPEIVITVGDRFETMATVLSAAYMNIPIAHTMGGEISGSIDESIRHAVTKFSHIHFPATKLAAERIRKLGEPESSIHLVGCPRIDLVKNILNDSWDVSAQNLFEKGVGDYFSLDDPFLLISQHPVTSEHLNAEDQMFTILDSVSEIGLPAIVLWPNADAGSGNISHAIRKWRETKSPKNLVHFFKNLPAEIYIKLMHKTSCLVGNSSSGLREGAYLGVPVVNIGSRQFSRERAENVIDVPISKIEITKAIAFQIKHGRYEKSTLYGDGSAGESIAMILSQLDKINTQKVLNY